MIDLNDKQPKNIKYIKGFLPDGRPFILKSFYSNIEETMRDVVAMANFKGGQIVFLHTWKRDNDEVINKDKLTNNIEHAIYALTLDVEYKIYSNNEDIILDIQKSRSTAYFSRRETTPHRQIAYRFEEKQDNIITLSKDEMLYSRVFKYMTIEAFLSSIYCESWRFFEPSKWNDKYEERFYCANYLIPGAAGNTPQLYATCITREKNSEAAWKVYSNGQGLGAHCLQLELDIAELRKQIKAQGYRLEEKKIVYLNENVILKLHDKDNQYYKKYFSNFTLNSFLNLLSLKRDAFTYEQEIRLFIIPDKQGKRNSNKKADSEDVKIDWSKVIIRVRVDKKCSDAELTTIQRACFKVGINPVINKHKFMGDANIPDGLKDIEFILFDIDDMPGSKKITIS